MNRNACRKGAARASGVLACLTMVALLAVGLSLAAEPESQERKVVARGAEQSAPVTPHIIDGDLRDLPRPVRWKPGDPVKEIPRRAYPRPGGFVPREYETGPDELMQLQSELQEFATEAFTDLTRNFPGQGYSGVNPPDTVGEAGPSHYIQMINAGGGTSVAIYDKATPTPNLVTSFMLDSLGSDACANGYGDPIVLWDRYAERWMLSEFSQSGNNLCVYISQTSDPVSGGWYFYGFTAPNFPDYPKYGIWPTDANGGGGSILVTSNESGPPAGYALDRGAMLVGDPATFQRVTFPELPGFNFQTTTPADPDGAAAPPVLSPAIIMRHRDTENHDGPVAPGDLLEMWTFDVDWENSANTTLTQEPSIDVAEFDSDLCGLTAFYCFPQPGTGTTLDPLREVIMWRLQYMNFGDYEALAGNFVTDVDGADHGGLRWFELRRSGGAWALHQEGTYSPDSDHRWMGASAMDQSGNFAVGYNVSSSGTYPSLRYTGRSFDDPLGIMGQPETSIHAGTASNSSNRYGDYAAMSLDPEDDCTFWFTGMDNTSSSWRTQIASFSFEVCGCELAPLPLSPGAAVGGDNLIEVSWDDSELPSVVEYLVQRSRAGGGPYETVAVVTDSSPGVGGGAGYVFDDTAVSGGITYYYVVVASDGEACKSATHNEASATATGACILEPLFAGLESVTTPFSGVCTLELAWSPAAAECGGPAAYDIYRSATAGFTPGPANLLASGITNTLFSDMNALVSGTPYYYVVRAVDQSNGVGEGNMVEVAGVPQGELTPETWADDAGDSGLAKMIVNDPWQVDATEGNLGPNVYKTGDYGNSTCADLATPEIWLGAASELSFYSKFEIESSWDKGEVQISTDGGASWSRVELSYPSSANNTSDACGLPTGTYFTGTNLDWALYTANLGAWPNQPVMIRFLISTDSSQTRTGWWIDDITITDTATPDACATGSSCAENPFVNVEPEGPMTVCDSASPVLDAGLTGGTGPFSYQWYGDGQPLPGEVAPSFQPTELGTHSYNVKVKSESCDDEVTDGRDTEVTLVNQPFFDGLDSVTDAQTTTCGVSIAWDAAATVCDGPVQYVVYRDTASPVSLAPENIVASGLTGTGYVDYSGLVEGTTYHYLVKALDRSTLQFDSNLVEGWALPSGPGSGLYSIFSENFEDVATWADWTVSTGPGPHSCGDWARSTSTSQMPSGGSGNYARALSQSCDPLLPLTSTSLDSPAIDLSISGVNSVTLEYDIYYNHLNGDDATVEVWDGADWQVIWADSNMDVNTRHSWDVTAYAAGNAAFQVRFNYQNANDDRWYSVDNVDVIVDIYNPCGTSIGPPPAPDGSAGTSPLRGFRATASGDTLELSWDTTSCTAADYILLYGDLADVADYTLSGSECDLGNDGSYVWSAVPGGDLYFIVAGTDGVGLESSWGADSVPTERNGMLASGECATTDKDIVTTCP